jgi:hypothetical protein
MSEDDIVREKVLQVLAKELTGIDPDILDYLCSVIADDPSMNAMDMSEAIGPFLESCAFTDSTEKVSQHCEAIYEALKSEDCETGRGKTALAAVTCLAESVCITSNLDVQISKPSLAENSSSEDIRQIVCRSFDQFVEEKDAAPQVAAMFLEENLQTTKHGTRLPRQLWEKDGLQKALHSLCTRPEVAMQLKLKPAWLVDSLTAAMAEEMVSSAHWEVASQGKKTQTTSQRRKGRNKKAASATTALPPLAHGTLVFALLVEDDAWHPAEVARPSADMDPPSEAAVVVEFLEYGRMKRCMLRKDLVLEDKMPNSDDDGDDIEGCCKMCQRNMPLTFHHLIPRATHSKMLHTFDRWTMRQRGIDICRPCHNMVHQTWEETELAENYNTLEALLATEQVKQFIKYARSQKTVSKDDATNRKLRYRR